MWPSLRKGQAAVVSATSQHQEKCLGDSSLIRRGSVPVAEGEVVFARKLYGEKNDSRGWNGSLLHRAGGGGLNDVRRSMADRAVGVCQAIRMKVRLLNAGAYEKKDGADDGKQKMSAPIVRPILCNFSHLYRILYAILAAALGSRGGGRQYVSSFTAVSHVYLDSPSAQD